MTALVAGDGCAEMVQVLLAARANPCHVSDSGSVPSCAAGNNVNFVPGLVHQLVTARADVNHQGTARTLKWRALLWFSRWASRHGTSQLLLRELAQVSRWTPLMAAAVRGKVEQVRELLALGADPTLRNDQGCTALDLVKSEFGAVPPLLQELLETSEPRK